MGLDIFENKGTSEKGCVEIEKWGFSVPFVMEFQGNSIYTLLLWFLAKILQNGTTFIQKLTPRLRIHMRNLNNFRQVELWNFIPKSWNLMGFFPKNTFLQAKILTIAHQNESFFYFWVVDVIFEITCQFFRLCITL